MPNALVHRYFEELLSAPDNIEVADEIFTDDVEFVNPVSANRIKGIDEYKAFAKRWYVGFPDRKFSVEEEIEEGEKVAAKFKITGTHNGEFMDAEPTGVAITVNGVNIFKMQNGKIQHVEAIFDPSQIWGPINEARGASGS